MAKEKGKPKRERKRKAEEEEEEEDTQGLVKYYTVIQEADGSLVCNCPAYRAAGKTCKDIVAARYHLNFGPPEDYMSAEQGPDDHGPAAKGKKTVPGRKSTGIKGIKTNLPPDSTIDQVHNSLLKSLEDPAWTPFPQIDATVVTAALASSIPGTKLTSGRPAAAKPLQPGRTGSRTNFNAKPGPKGPAFNSILPPAPSSPMSPSKITADTSDTVHASDKPVTDPVKPKPAKKYVNVPISHAIREDLDILDIDFKRWNSKAYQLREDEVLEIVEIMNAFCLATNNGILVYGPSYARDADLLRNVVWESSDNEPILAGGGAAFPEDSVLKKAWLHSQTMTLSILLVFRHDPGRKHWLLFDFALDNEISTTCYEPLKNHLKLPDIQKMHLLASFFSIHRPNRPPPERRLRNYDAYELDIQRDGDSCGFWMATLAFLRINQVPLSDENIAILESFSVLGLKNHWKSIVTSWRIEDLGLGVAPVNNFLRYWDFRHQNSAACIAPRPTWVSRFDPAQASVHRNSILGTSSGPATANKNAPASEPHSQMAMAKVNPELMSMSALFAELTNGGTLDMAITEIQGIASALGQDSYLTFNHDKLSGTDLRRFFQGGKANDELINLYIAAVNYPVLMRDAPPDRHIGFPLTLPPPDRDYMHQAIVIFDSWGPNQKKTPPYYPRIYQDCLLLAELFVENSKGAIKRLNPTFDRNLWEKNSAEIAPQENGVDCGFYLLISLLQVLSFNAINRVPQCPPILRFHGSNMNYIRTMLAMSLIEWCAQGYKVVEKRIGNETFIEPPTSQTLQQPTQPECGPTLAFKDTATTSLAPAFELRNETARSGSYSMLRPDKFVRIAPQITDADLLNTPKTSPTRPKIKQEDLEELALTSPQIIDVDLLNTPEISPTRSKIKEEDLEKLVLNRPFANFTGTPVPSSVDGEDELLPPDDTNNGIQLALSQDSEPPDFPFSCRCGAHADDGTDLALGLDVIQCSTCADWSHISCQRYGRASNLKASQPFFCDLCSKWIYPDPPEPFKGRGRTRTPRFVPGLGALAKHGKYYYPVRLLKKADRKKGWKVQFWRGCQFKSGDPGPNSADLVLESDLVDSLFGDQHSRRKIRLGKYTHAHEIAVEEDVIDNFRNVPFTPELDNILSPHTDTLLSILNRPLEDNLNIPSIKYIILAKEITVRFAGDLTLQEQAQIMNWFYHRVPDAKNTVPKWAGCPPYAHAITLVIAKRNEEAFRQLEGFPLGGTESQQQEALWNLAWRRQRRAAGVHTVDVDHECLGLLEQWMFESSNRAGVAGEEQWGLDAGKHQGGWVPYTGLPNAWSSHINGDYTRDEGIFNHGKEFSEGSSSESDLPVPKKAQPEAPSGGAPCNTICARGATTVWRCGGIHPDRELYVSGRNMVYIASYASSAPQVRVGAHVGIAGSKGSVAPPYEWRSPELDVFARRYAGVNPTRCVPRTRVTTSTCDSLTDLARRRLVHDPVSPARAVDLLHPRASTAAGVRAAVNREEKRRGFAQVLLLRSSWAAERARFSKWRDRATSFSGQVESLLGAVLLNVGGSLDAVRGGWDAAGAPAYCVSGYGRAAYVGEPARQEAVQKGETSCAVTVDSVGGGRECTYFTELVRVCEAVLDGSSHRRRAYMPTHLNSA
ncbi:hypothetical protein C8R44DRAFT_986254 [Mycena epipterygia]|nr:hypothetical protein C8R44DRAFT_986254 [Mycena epipterygia]